VVPALTPSRPGALLLAGTDLPTLEHAPSELRERARDLLNRPPYRDGGEGPVTDLLRRAREAVARWLELVLDTLTGDTRAAWGIVAIGTVLLLVAVWRATRGWSGDRSIVEVPASRPSRSAAAWAEEADTHAASGRWRDAVRCRYAAVVGSLVEGGVLRDVPGRTVRELDRELASAAPTVAGEVRDAGAVFEEVWYGHEDAGPVELAVVDRAAAEVDRVLGRTAKVPS
jgi:hypothetical protein